MSPARTNQHHFAALDGVLVTTTTRPDVNSWTAKFNEFSYKELLDALAINAVTPFILIRECIGIMQHATPAHIINVSSREGMFEPPGNKRSSKHVHTNMAKAALGMMTQTLGEEFRPRRVYINAVDPGYLSHQHSLTHNGIDGRVESNVPLTWDDGAARVVNPVIREPPITGAFFKDYRQRDWLSGYL
jgi:NAD(P)-dependent dehydrogenase (short-subunit alcohol dehydrogenase family)